MGCRLAPVLEIARSFIRKSAQHSREGIGAPVSRIQADLSRDHRGYEQACFLILASFGTEIAHALVLSGLNSFSLQFAIADLCPAIKFDVSTPQSHFQLPLANC